MRADGSGSCGLGETTLGERRALKGSERGRLVTDAGVHGSPLVAAGGLREVDLGRGDGPRVFTSALWGVWEDLCRGRYTGPGRSVPCCLQILTVEQDLCLT